MIRKFLIVGLMALMGAAGAWAQGSRMVTDTIHSSVLGAPRAYTVYLPASFDTQPEKHYPVLYLLHGLSGCNEDWQKNSQLRLIADRMTRNGEIDEMVIVTPDADLGMGPDLQCGYFNVPGWNYEDFFFEELVPQVEQKYRAIGDKRHRAIAGLSMGGGGTTAYAQKHPDMFVAAYPMSALMTAKHRMDRTVGDDKYAKYNRGVLENDNIDFVTEADDARKEALRSVEWYVDCGDDDFLLQGNLDFYMAMRAAGIPCELRVRDGGHNWEYWNSALLECLPWVSRAFNRK